jgi:hypothetical protein
MSRGQPPAAFRNRNCHRDGRTSGWRPRSNRIVDANGTVVAGDRTNADGGSDLDLADQDEHGVKAMCPGPDASSPSSAGTRLISAATYAADQSLCGPRPTCRPGTARGRRPPTPKAEGQRISRTGGRRLGPHSHTRTQCCRRVACVTGSKSEGKLGPPVVPQLPPGLLVRFTRPLSRTRRDRVCPSHRYRRTRS